MKQANQELKYSRMRQYHRKHPWSLGPQGVFIPHDYSQNRVLSWWADLGFILNGRRVMVWWIHPRMKYADAIEAAGWEEAGEPPESSRDFLDANRCIKKFKRLGKSRKKVIAYQAMPATSAQREYFDKLGVIQNHISTEGIDLVVRPSMTVRTINWCTGVELCLPIEILTESDVIALAKIVRHTLKNGRSLAALSKHIPTGYQYGRKQWLAELDARNMDREVRQKNDKQ